MEGKVLDAWLLGIGRGAKNSFYHDRPHSMKHDLMKDIKRSMSLLYPSP
jgi:hypothetical protein